MHNIFSFYFDTYTNLVVSEITIIVFSLLKGMLIAINYEPLDTMKTKKITLIYCSCASKGIHGAIWSVVMTQPRWPHVSGQEDALVQGST